jgi:hypothetical protein
MKKYVLFNMGAVEDALRDLANPESKIPDTKSYSINLNLKVENRHGDIIYTQVFRTSDIIFEGRIECPECYDNEAIAEFMKEEVLAILADENLSNSHIATVWNLIQGGVQLGEIKGNVLTASLGWTAHFK